MDLESVSIDSTSGTLKLTIEISGVELGQIYYFYIASSGNVGGFIIDSSEVRSYNNNLRLKSNGQIAGWMSMSGK